MLTLSDAFYLALFFTAFGIGIGLMAAFWRPRKPRIEEGTALRRAVPHFQSWPPEGVIFTEFQIYNNRAEWARAKGLV